MSRESEVKALLIADPLLMTILLGGIYTDEEIGVEGYRRGDDSPTAAAFDADGFLLPTACVRQRGEIPYQDIRNLSDKFTATIQVVEIYFYERRGHTQVDLAKHRAWEILEGERLTDSYPIWWDGDSPHLPDVGPIANSTTVLQEWVVITIKQVAA